VVELFPGFEILFSGSRADARQRPVSAPVAANRTGHFPRFSKGLRGTGQRVCESRRENGQRNRSVDL